MNIYACIYTEAGWCLAVRKTFYLTDATLLFLKTVSMCYVNDVHVLIVE